MTSLSDLYGCFLKIYNNAGSADHNCLLYAIEKQSIPYQEPQDEVLGFASPSPAPQAEAGLPSPAPHEEGFGSLSPVPQEEGAGFASPSFEPHEEPQEEEVMLFVCEAM
jgi:hypothetical protein